jgi:hypothetical protein
MVTGEKDMKSPRGSLLKKIFGREDPDIIY